MLPVTTLAHAIQVQLADAHAVIAGHLGSTLRAIHLFSSAVDGGLKPRSDIDLMVTIAAPMDDSTRRALTEALLTVSAPPGTDMSRRALEVTVVVLHEIVPWRYPARREMQFGEWLRDDILAGRFEPAVLDHDLAILLTQVLHHSINLGLCLPQHADRKHRAQQSGKQYLSEQILYYFLHFFLVLIVGEIWEFIFEFS